jgi:predicted RNA binding protein YcfA (HicA-like mRNA interferase family)
MPRLPQISGRELIRLLESLGYESLRNVGATCDYVEFRQRVNTTLPGPITRWWPKER